MRGGAIAGCVVLLALVSGCKPGDEARVYEDGSMYVPGSYTVRESGVRLRDGGTACRETPGTGNCANVLAGLSPGDHLYPVCQRKGQLVGQNSWWVYVDAPRGRRGWVASWFLTCPTNALPEVDECVPDDFD